MGWKKIVFKKYANENATPGKRLDLIYQMHFEVSPLAKFGNTL